MESQDALLHSLARAKYTLAFSNLVDASDYTHRSRAYITGRWTDALAHGAIVAGVVLGLPYWSTPLLDAPEASNPLQHLAFLELGQQNTTELTKE